MRELNHVQYTGRPLCSILNIAQKPKGIGYTGGGELLLMKGAQLWALKREGWANMEQGEEPHRMRDMNHFPSKYQGGQNTTYTGRQNIRKRIEVYSCL